MRDLAGRRHLHPFERVPPWAWWAFVAGVLAYSGWFLTSNYRDLVAERVADARVWRIEGPPCPRTNRATVLAVRDQRLRRFEYEGVTFIRRFGHVSCAPIYEKGGKSDRFYPVCQFTSPGDLMIRTKKGEFYFRPGPGQPATISTAHGEARCVMASKFSLDPKP